MHLHFPVLSVTSVANFPAFAFIRAIRAIRGSKMHLHFSVCSVTFAFLLVAAIGFATEESQQFPRVEGGQIDSWQHTNEMAGSGEQVVLSYRLKPVNVFATGPDQECKIRIVAYAVNLRSGQLVLEDTHWLSARLVSGTFFSTPEGQFVIRKRLGGGEYGCFILAYHDLSPQVQQLIDMRMMQVTINAPPNEHVIYSTAPKSDIKFKGGHITSASPTHGETISSKNAKRFEFKTDPLEIEESGSALMTVHEMIVFERNTRHLLFAKKGYVSHGFGSDQKSNPIEDQFEYFDAATGGIAPGDYQFLLMIHQLIGDERRLIDFKLKRFQVR